MRHCGRRSPEGYPFLPSSLEVDFRSSSTAWHTFVPTSIQDEGPTPPAYGETTPDVEAYGPMTSRNSSLSELPPLILLASETVGDMGSTCVCRARGDDILQMLHIHLVCMNFYRLRKSDNEWITRIERLHHRKWAADGVFSSGHIDNTQWHPASVLVAESTC